VTQAAAAPTAAALSKEPLVITNFDYRFRVAGLEDLAVANKAHDRLKSRPIPPMSGMNCLGRLLRYSGQTRVPEPPHMITGRILVISARVSLASLAPTKPGVF
jgi:hypothetical protein